MENKESGEQSKEQLNKENIYDYVLKMCLMRMTNQTPNQIFIIFNPSPLHEVLRNYS